MQAKHEKLRSWLACAFSSRHTCAVEAREFAKPGHQLHVCALGATVSAEKAEADQQPYFLWLPALEATKAQLRRASLRNRVTNCTYAHLVQRSAPRKRKPTSSLTSCGCLP